jgi:hypothetical protein
MSLHMPALLPQGCINSLFRYIYQILEYGHSSQKDWGGGRGIMVPSQTTSHNSSGSKSERKVMAGYESLIMTKVPEKPPCYV